jgi:ABC-type xylose transport system permease subunit
MRVLLGLVKGGLVGAVVGFAATRLHLAAGPLAWPVYGLVGLLVGLVCGKAIWRQETLWTPLIKGIFGVLVTLGLYWVSRKVLGGLVLPFNAALGAPADAPLPQVPVLLAPLLGIVYGIFVEVDDSDGKKKEAAASR